MTRPPQSNARLELRRILGEFDPEPVELFLGALCAWWGLWLALPFVTWLKGDSFYSVQRAVFRHEWAEGVFFGGLGALRILAVLRRWSPTVRSVAAALVGLGWGVVAVSCVWFRWESTATPVYSTFCVANLWVCFRLERERWLVGF